MDLSKAVKFLMEAKGLNWEEPDLEFLDMLLLTKARWHFFCCNRGSLTVSQWEQLAEILGVPVPIMCLLATEELDLAVVDQHQKRRTKLLIKYAKLEVLEQLGLVKDIPKGGPRPKQGVTKAVQGHFRKPTPQLLLTDFHRLLAQVGKEVAKTEGRSLATIHTVSPLLSKILKDAYANDLHIMLENDKQFLEVLDDE
jgi:hypothetical protein